MTSGVPGLVLVAMVVFGLNLVPAFAPPTWAVLVLLRLATDVAPVLLVLVGAAAAAGGRLTLAICCRRLADHLPHRYVTNARAAGERVMSSRGGAVAGLGLFALSPLPSAQLFEAAGLMSVRLIPFTAAFFVGRLISYSVYVSGASAVRSTGFGQLLVDSLTSPWAIGLQVLLLIGIVLLGRVDWANVGRRRQP